jgi:thiosulfate dehydrogenase [quinone] large subunit
LPSLNLLPSAESVVRVLILVGLVTRLSLIGGALLMIVLPFGTCLVQDWHGAGEQLVYQIAIFALLFLRGYNRWSADTFVRDVFRSCVLTNKIPFREVTPNASPVNCG